VYLGEDAVWSSVWLPFAFAISVCERSCLLLLRLLQPAISQAAAASSSAAAAAAAAAAVLPLFPSRCCC